MPEHGGGEARDTCDRLELYMCMSGSIPRARNESKSVRRAAGKRNKVSADERLAIFPPLNVDSQCAPSTASLSSGIPPSATRRLTDIRAEGKSVVGSPRKSAQRGAAYQVLFAGLLRRRSSCVRVRVLESVERDQHARSLACESGRDGVPCNP
jgi:hypothetical protein